MFGVYSVSIRRCLPEREILMASAHDVAQYILERQGPMSAMKLQKLVYYSQAWNLVWQGRELFPEVVEAWANGPVVRDLYSVHRGYFQVSRWPCGSSSRLSQAERSTVEGVLHFYGPKEADWLSDLTHKERPWLDARKGLNPGERSTREITPEAMASYYGSL
jgi:uncharacterized phage-associated protein